MNFKHRDGEDAADFVTVPGVGNVPVENGRFAFDGRTGDVEAVKSAGHTPVGGDDTSDDGSESVPDLTQYAEEDLVTMDYAELQSLGADFDDVKGNWGQDKLEEALIRKRRAQVDDGA